MHKRGEGIKRLRMPHILTCICGFCAAVREGCTVCIRSKCMAPLSLNAIIKSMFFPQVNIESVVRVYSKDTDVFILLVTRLHQLSCKSMQLNWSTEELIDLTLIASGYGDEKSKVFAGPHLLTGCDTVEKFTSKSK